MSTFDVIIIGGGPAGCATALSLCKHTGSEGGSFLLLDDTDPSTFKIGESLPPESIRLLHHIHPTLPKRLTQETESGTHLLCTGNASSWASVVLEERHAILNPFGHGFHLNRVAFDESLRQCVRDCRSEAVNSTPLCGVGVLKGRFKGVEKEPSGSFAIHADVDNEDKVFRAKWVVDATGRKASLATKLGARIITSDPLLAFYALFTGPSSFDRPDVDNDHRTLIEAAADGWFYSALLSRAPCTRIVAYHTLPTHPSAKCVRRRDGFLDVLHASAPHISTIIRQNDYEMSGGGFPRCTAAGSSYLDKTCDEERGWIAVGDSAMAFDPLSSQGMMTALEMGYYVGIILAGQIRGENPGPVEEMLTEMYRRVREEYVRQRAYYYGIVKRFHGQEFWNNVTSTISTTEL